MRGHKPRRGAGTAKALAAGRQPAAASAGSGARAHVRMHDIGRMRAGSTVLAAHLVESGATARAATPGQRVRAGQDRVT